MNAIRSIFDAILYEPIFNIFVGLYNIIPDVGVVIVLITVAIKLALFPSTKNSIMAQKSMQELQPKLEELKKKHKNDQQKLAQETMALYKEHKVNPLGSCLPILIQLPILLALYWVFQAGLTSDNFDALYSFVPAPEFLNPVSFGLFDLSEPSIVLAVLAALAQAWQARSMSRRRPPKAAGKGGKDEDMMAMTNKMMLYFLPAFTFIIALRFPAGVALYWFFSTLITAIQQWILFKEN